MSLIIIVDKIKNLYTNLKDKLKLTTITNPVYVRITYLLIIIAFTYTLHRGDLKSLIEILKVALSFLELLLGV